MKLKIPVAFPTGIRDENRYLVHCKNVALILAHADSVQRGKAKIDQYIQTTGAEKSDE